jgi:hypothetical protein
VKIINLRNATVIAGYITPDAVANLTFFSFALMSGQLGKLRGSKSMTWPTIQLGKFLTLKRGYDLPASSRQNGDAPVISSSGITGSHNVAKAQGPGVVTGRYGTLGEVYFVREDFWPLNTSLLWKTSRGMTLDSPPIS